MILITGGLGYLGTRIAIQLLATGQEIRIATSKNHLKLPTVLKKCELVVIDLSNTESIRKATKDITLILHLAGMNAMDSSKEPCEAVRVNGIGTRNLLECARLCGVSRFIYFSTVHVYGSPLKGSLLETSAVRPESDYAISNRLAEDYVLREKALETIVLRLSNVFGVPHNANSSAWSLVANDFCKQAIVHKEIQIRTSGQQKRDFLSMSDLLASLPIFLTSPSASINNEIFNVGGVTLSIKELAEVISETCAKLFEYEPKISTGSQKEIVTNFNFNSEKFKNVGGNCLGFHDEIKRTLVYCHSHFVGTGTIK